MSSVQKVFTVGRKLRLLRAESLCNVGSPFFFALAYLLLGSGDGSIGNITTGSGVAATLVAIATNVAVATNVAATTRIAIAINVAAPTSRASREGN